MTYATGIAGEVHSLWEAVGSSHNGGQRIVLELGEVSCLVDEHDVVFLSLVLQHVAL